MNTTGASGQRRNEPLIEAYQRDEQGPNHGVLGTCLKAFSSSTRTASTPSVPAPFRAMML